MVTRSYSLIKWPRARCLPPSPGAPGRGGGAWKATPARTPTTHAAIAIAKLRHAGDAACRRGVPTGAPSEEFVGRSCSSSSDACFIIAPRAPRSGARRGVPARRRAGDRRPVGRTKQKIKKKRLRTSRTSREDVTTARRARRDESRAGEVLARRPGRALL